MIVCKENVSGGVEFHCGGFEKGLREKNLVSRACARVLLFSSLLFSSLKAHVTLNRVKMRKTPEKPLFYDFT